MAEHARISNPRRASTELPARIADLTVADLDVAYQPIVDLRTGWTAAYEAFAQACWPELADPVVLFARARREGCVGQLGRLVRRVALELCDDAPLFVKVDERELDEGWLVRPDDPLFFHDRTVYLEVTESAAFGYFERCMSVLREVASRGGAQLAIDDLGAGDSNLKRVLDLEPRIVKLDAALIRGIEKNRRQQILVRQMVALCQELGADVVAKGIETVEELVALRDAGAPYGQGSLFARPGYPLPSAAWPFERATSPTGGRLAGEPLSSGKFRL